MKKKLLPVVLTILLSLSSSITAFANETQEILPNQDPNAEFTVTYPSRSGRTFIGQELFTLEVKKLDAGSIITNGTKTVSSSYKKIGIYSYGNGVATVGVCYLDPSTGKYISEGSVQPADGGGGVRTDSFTPSYKSGVNSHFGYVKNNSKNNITTSQKYTFVGMN